MHAIDHWTLPRSFASGFLKNLDSLAIVRVAGDSAEPEYQAGERILVDRSQVAPSPPGIYFLWDGFGLILKRVEVIFGDGIPVKLRVSSINQAYKACEQALNGVRIFGRVVGKWQWK
ncbi:S24 family peptidase [Sorlinia euscelidii]|uniref:S24 family peptidase n=1 Tax=Sorlinia euscelidii TaxID=3081148 RepID=UPI00374E093A